ncbi:MAG: hypothetical protein KGZ58_09775 [Ignavibacteriales bacterium]|nr:hypothetical protein [Ignavibacteriales bacterium]
MTKTQHRLYVGLFFVVGIASTILLCIYGYEYYASPLTERPFHSRHSSLKPSGLLGHGLGILGSLMMMFGVAIYMVRKRMRRFSQWGLLKYWLEFHIFLCTVGPIFVLFHTAFKFGGIVSVSFWSMVAVVLSGVIGRYIYVQIPRTIEGKELNVQELNSLNENFSRRMKEEFGVTERLLAKVEAFASITKYQSYSLGKSLVVALSEYFSVRGVLAELRKEMKATSVSSHHVSEIVKVAKSKLALARHIGLLRSMHKLFNYWHIVHLPFAITMFVIMIIHVAVTIIFGYQWIF